MTTTPAMPELPEHAGFIDIGPVARRAYTADQMDARYLQGYNDALAALQSQPAAAGVSDEEIIAIKKATKAADPTQPWGDTLAFARAILALRPQAVPMTEDTARLDWLGANPACKIFNEDGEWSFDGKLCLDLRDAIDNARGITAQGAQGGEG